MSYTLTDTQWQMLTNTLMELPAKFSLSILQFMATVPKNEEKTVELQEEE